MHLVSFSEPLGLGPQGVFAPGTYLMEDLNAGELIVSHPEMKFELNKWSPNLPPTTTPSKILLIGTTGFGDGILLTPCLREIKRRFPEAQLHISVFNEHRQVFANLPYVDGFAEYPLPAADLEQYQMIYTIEGAVQHNPKSAEQHMTDRFAEHLGLLPLESKTADYIVSTEERAWILSSFPRRKGRRRLGMQVQAGVVCRTYPGKHLSVVLTKLIQEGWEIVMMGRQGEFKTQETAYLTDLSRHGLTFRQSAAYLLSCDAFLGPDSSLLHVAGCLKVPSVGLFGPYDWRLRTAYYPTVFSIQGKEGCHKAPCCWIQSAGKPYFPPDGPCAQVNVCVPLANILPERVVAKILQISGSVSQLPEVAVPDGKIVPFASGQP